MSEQAGLREELSRALERAQRSYAAFRPEVAAYLFERGFQPTADALAGSPARDKVLQHLFHLQLESIGSKMFGVSTDAWRDNPAYPDRYFPIVWIDVVPKLLPRLPPERQLATLVSLFNLGEHLVVGARSVGALVAEALANDLDTAAREGVEPLILSTMADLGLIPKDAVPRRVAREATVDRLDRLPPVMLAAFDAAMIPGALGFEDEVWWVADRLRPLTLAFSSRGDGGQLIERRARGITATESPSLPFSARWDAGGLEVGVDGAVKLPDGRAIGCVDPRCIAAIAASPAGLLLARRFSQRVERYALRGGAG